MYILHTYTCAYTHPYILKYFIGTYLLKYFLTLLVYFLINNKMKKLCNAAECRLY